MKKLLQIWKSLLFDTYGNIALASFVVCVVSGIFLAISYDVEKAYDSIALMLITNLPAVVFRNMHYWSAQGFLVFSILHTFEHIKLKSSRDLDAGIWIRLVLSLLFIFYVMLSGFILKGDADSVQAQRILESLILKIPVIGQFLAGMILGEANELQLIYIHHVATATLVIVYILFEHSKTLWTSRSTLLIVLAITTILSFSVHAPLHNNIVPVLKGPWYFIGMQEIMHWTGRPGWIWIVLLSVLLIVYITQYAGDKTTRRLYRILVLFSVVYLTLTLIGYFFRGENWKWDLPWEGNITVKRVSPDFGFRKADNRAEWLTSSDIPVVRGKREACMICHEDVSGFSPAHDPMAIGCTSCHLGDPFTLDKTAAHKQMVVIPGNLNFSRITCGTVDCHPAIEERIHTSLMTTNSGIVGVDRMVFGEESSPDTHAHIQDLGYSGADKHLRDLCANCHLGNEKEETGPVDQLSRGGGCNACHLNYSNESYEQHIRFVEKGRVEEALPRIHPSLDLSITNDHCFGCHSRSGRIATNYEGWHETLLSEVEVNDSTGYRVLQDKRVFRFVSADVHHTAGMECIDCHTSYGTMGDGFVYSHEEQAVKIRCADCHFEQKPLLTTYDSLDLESKKIFDLRKFSHISNRMILTEKDEIPLVNTFIEGDSAYMLSKNSGKKHPLNPPASLCTKGYGHQSLSCSSCHSAWAPTCIGCHNAYDPAAKGYDLLDGKYVQGEWVEYVGDFFAELPALGVRDGIEKKIEPAIPGMIMTINKESYTKNDVNTDGPMTFHRLYAPAAPHTTGKKGRSCSSCHNSSLALGYGQGTLNYKLVDDSGVWEFSPAFANSQYDGLPEDAWIGFPSNFKIDGGQNEVLLRSTRSDFRPLSLEEQKKILLVGACLSCHKEDSGIMEESLNMEFKDYLRMISDSCVLPDWK